MTPPQPGSQVTLAFVGYADPDMVEGVREYEDRVLALLGDHGAEALFRGHRSAGQDAALPVEVQVLRFPSQSAVDDFMVDPRRVALLEEFGDVFTTKHALSVEVIA